MDKRIIATVLLLALLAGAIVIINPRVSAQQYGARETDTERLQKELTRKLDDLSRQLNDMETDITYIKRKVDDIDRKVK